MTFIDTHTHIYLNEFQADIEEVIARALKDGISQFYLPAIDSNETAHLTSLVERFPQNCFAMAGLHPCSVKENNERELELIYDSLKKGNVAGIGETGLDFYWDKTCEKQQYACLKKQLEWGLEFNLPVILHTRNATKETIDVVKPFAAKGSRGIFHCFGSSLEDANEIIEMGFYLGIGGVLTYKNSGLDKIIEQIDCKHIVLETDAPYLSPVPFRGKRNEPSYIKIIASKLAEIKKITLEEVASITTANALKVFNSTN